MAKWVFPIYIRDAEVKMYEDGTLVVSLNNEMANNVNEIIIFNEEQFWNRRFIDERSKNGNV